MTTRVDTTSCIIQVVVIVGSMCSKKVYNTCILQTIDTQSINTQPTHRPHAHTLQRAISSK